MPRLGLDPDRIAAVAEAHRIGRRAGTTPLLDPSDERTIAAMRLLLAAAALVVTAFAHPGSESSRQVIYVSLSLYSAYSAVLYLVAQRRADLKLPGIEWADVGWYTLFTAVGGGTTSPFFSFYYFAILVASFRGGLRAGIQVTLASAALFTLVGYWAVEDEGALTWSRFFLRPIYLLIIGFMMARWGGLEIRLKQRLVLLKEISALSNPRLGEGQTLGSTVERLRAFHDADSAVLVVADAAAAQYVVRRADRTGHDTAINETPMPPHVGELLTAFPWTAALVFRGGAGEALDLHALNRGAAAAADIELCQRVAEVLGCESFVSAPVRYDATAMARVYLTSQRPAFDIADAEFLVLAFDQIMPAIEHLRLLDRLASEAATHERQRLARDLHDSVIQPYIGLQMGLTAALQQVPDHDHPLATLLQRLVRLTEDEIGSLRRYAGELKGAQDEAGGLLAGIRRIARRFADASGIHVEVHAPERIAVDDRLAAEVFQIVAEGLSNVRRHTAAPEALIAVERRETRLVLRVENPGESGRPFRAFVPRSITERAAALGGSARVLPRDDEGAVVQVEIPL